MNVNILVIEQKFQNNTSCRIYKIKTSNYATSRKKNNVENFDKNETN